MRHNQIDPPDTTEHCSEVGARRLAARIKDYWLARGYRGITTGIRRMTAPRHKRRMQAVEVFGVVSNIGENGYPPKEPS